MAFNPKVSEFLEKHPDKTLLGLWWAMQWRIVVAVYGTVFVVGIFFAGLVSVFSQQ